MNFSTLGLFLRRTVGGILVLLVVFPVFRLLAHGDVGGIGADVLSAAERARDMIVFGSLVIVLIAVLLARLISLEIIERLSDRVSQWLVAIPRIKFALVLGTIACVVTALFTRYILSDKPSLFDAMAQLLHARYLAAGHLAGPVGVWSPFLEIQNSLMLPTGWVSQYPPGHTVLLAVGFMLHAVWLVGPVLAGITVLFTALTADRLLPNDQGVARFAACLVAVSPFLIALAGAYMNHITAAAGIAIAMYSATRSRDDNSLVWGIATGIALGFVFTVRPLSAITTGIVVTLLWLESSDTAISLWSRIGITARRLGAAIVGALPFGIITLIYNALLFGHPLKIGYMVAQGPGMGLGFHRDPWGNWYGPWQALAYTSSDLTTLSLNLQETPLPAVILCGLYLIIARRLTPGVRTIALWALIPVAFNALYWHHGIFMGPRMLNEVAPAWTLLTVISAVALVRYIPRDRYLGPYSLRGFAAMTGIAGLAVGAVYLAPQRLSSYGGSFMASTRLPIPHTETPSLVFVHGAWTARIAMRLAGTGMRLDSVEAVMHQNSTCAVDAFAKAYGPASSVERRTLVRTLNFASFPKRALAELAESPGVRGEPGERLTPGCSQELAADRLGIVDVSPLSWQGDLPGLPGRGAMVVRDLGPEENLRLIRALPRRQPLLLYRPAPDAPPVLVPYAAGMSQVWGGSGG